MYIFKLSLHIVGWLRIVQYGVYSYVGMTILIKLYYCILLQMQQSYRNAGELNVFNGTWLVDKTFILCYFFSSCLMSNLFRGGIWRRCIHSQPDSNFLHCLLSFFDYRVTISCSSLLFHSHLPLFTVSSYFIILCPLQVDFLRSPPLHSAHAIAYTSTRITFTTPSRVESTLHQFYMNPYLLHNSTLHFAVKITLISY